jgi:copper chaperone CopZ
MDIQNEKNTIKEALEKINRTRKSDINLDSPDKTAFSETSNDDAIEIINQLDPNLSKVHEEDTANSTEVISEKNNSISDLKYELYIHFDQKFSELKKELKINWVPIIGIAVAILTIIIPLIFFVTPILSENVFYKMKTTIQNEITADVLRNITFQNGSETLQVEENISDNTDDN